MNEHDSERVRDMLRVDGYVFVDEIEDADVVIFNTCSVRKHAEDRVYGKLGTMKKMKAKKPGFIIGIVGCMAEAQKEDIFKNMPHVDFLCGPADLDRIPEIIEDIRDGAGRIALIGGHSLKKIPEFPLDRNAGHAGFVKIMEGCDNFCSYCVVPYVRGRERSRPSGEILEEIKGLLENGVVKITLLGQNVNSYGKGLKEKIDFVGLLEKINKLVPSPLPSPQRGEGFAGEGVKISFLTSHPKDAGVKLFKAMADLKYISKNLHLAMQSGSNKILRLMNRGYTIEQYKKLVKDFRRIVKAGTITTDIIVGFPKETERDFQDTLKAMKDIKFNFAYIFKYSPRPFTKAGKMKDDVPDLEKERRHAILLEMQRKIV